MKTRYLRYELREAFYVEDLQRQLGFEAPTMQPQFVWRGWCRRVAAALIAEKITWFDVAQVFCRAWGAIPAELDIKSPEAWRAMRRQAVRFMRVLLVERNIEKE